MKRFVKGIISMCIMVAILISVCSTYLPLSVFAGGYQDSLVNSLKSQVQEYLARTNNVTAAIDYAGTLSAHFKIGTKLDSSFSGHCWNHTKEMSQLLFGVNIPAGTGTYYLTKKNANWEQIGQVVNGSASDIMRLLLKSQPGDIIQYRSSYTKYNGKEYSHTAMIYSNDGSTVKTYNAGSLKVFLYTLTASNIASSLGSFASTSSSTRGMTIYRCVKAPAYSGGNENLNAFINSIDTSIAGYYYLTTNYASIQQYPEAAADLVRSLSHGEVVKITARGTNSYGNIWYRTTDGYVFPKTDTGVVRLTKVPTAYYFEPLNVTSFNSSLSEKDYVGSVVYQNSDCTYSDVTKKGCIIYEKNGSSYIEVARAIDNGKLASNGRIFYNVSQNPTSTNTKFYITGTENRYYFTPNRTYYYRMFVEYEKNNCAIAYSYNYPADSEYYSFVAPAATSTQITATYSDLAAVNVGTTSASLAFTCNLTGATNASVSDIYIYLYSSNLQCLAQVYHSQPSFGGASYFSATSSNPYVMTYAFKPDTTYKVRVCATISGNDYYSDYVAFNTKPCQHSFGNWRVGEQATCLEYGYYVRECTICGEEEYMDYEPTGHTFGNWRYDNDEQHKHVCSCGETEYEPHSWNAGVITKEATSSENGIKTYTCSICGGIKTEIIPKLTISVSSISVLTLPSKTAYEIGEALNTSGLSIKVNYSDGSTTAITGGFATLGFDSSSAGEKTVTVSYEGKTTTFRVTVWPVTIGEDEPQMVIGSKAARAGETVTITFVLKNVPQLKSIALSGFTYDTSALELISGAWEINDSLLQNWNADNETAVIAFSGNRDVNCEIFTLTFNIKDGVAVGSYSIGCSITAKTKNASGAEDTVAIPTVNGSIDVVSVVRGDVDGDGTITSDDAIQVLYFTLLPDIYTVNQDVDFNGDGLVTSDDAIYLLYYTLLPDLYPLN